MTPSVPQPLDVRTIHPSVRHATIFSFIEALAAGEVFAIVNGHDPVPLRRQIEARYGDAFSWTYVVAGPDVWQVEIGRRAVSRPAASRPASEEAACGGEGQSCTCGG